MTARQLASLLESEGAGGLGELSLGELSAGFSLTGSPQWFRLASRQEYDRVELEWPVGDQRNSRAAITEIRG
jgi:hypothetical protein